MPWGFNAFLTILTLRLGKGFTDLPIVWRHLSSMMKHGVSDVLACWAMNLGDVSRDIAMQIPKHFELSGKPSFGAFVAWIANLPTEFVEYGFSGSGFEKQRFMKAIVELVPDNGLVDSIRQNITVLKSPVQGIPYAEREIPASQVQPGDNLTLEAEPGNPHDPYAVRVLFRGMHIGYVQRDSAKIISREMMSGRLVKAQAETVTTPTEKYPFHWIEMKVELG